MILDLGQAGADPLRELPAGQKFGHPGPVSSCPVVRDSPCQQGIKEGPPSGVRIPDAQVGTGQAAVHPPARVLGTLSGCIGSKTEMQPLQEAAEARVSEACCYVSCTG